MKRCRAGGAVGQVQRQQEGEDADIAAVGPLRCVDQLQRKERGRGFKRVCDKV